MQNALRAMKTQKLVSGHALNSLIHIFTLICHVDLHVLVVIATRVRILLELSYTSKRNLTHAKPELDPKKIITRRSMSVHWVACGSCYSKTEGTELGGIKLQPSRQFFSSPGSLRPFKGSPRSRTSRGPLTHTFIRRNTSFSEVKNLAIGLLIICQKEEVPVIFRKNRHALLTCGSAVTQRFIPYCQLSCVLSSRRFKLSLRNM